MFHNDLHSTLLMPDNLQWLHSPHLPYITVYPWLVRHIYANCARWRFTIADVYAMQNDESLFTSLGFLRNELGVHCVGQHA